MNAEVKTVTKEQTTKAIAQCIIRDGDAILVRKGFDSQKEEFFFKAPGGTIEFGEYSWATIRRQIKKEIGQEIKNLTFVGPIESIFQYEGQNCHEIVFVFEGEIANKEMYKQKKIEIGPPKNMGFMVEWKLLSDFYRKKAVLYPDGLLEMLKRQP